MPLKSEVKCCEHVKYLELLIRIQSGTGVSDAEQSLYAFLDAWAYQSGVDGQLLVGINQQKNVPNVGL